MHRRMQAALPKPPATDQRRGVLLAVARHRMTSLSERNSDAAPYVAVVAMNRLQRPCGAVRLLPMLVCRQTGDALDLERPTWAWWAKSSFGRMDALRASDPGDAYRPRSTRTRFWSPRWRSSPISPARWSRKWEVRRDGAWGQRLLEDRAARMGDVMGRVHGARGQGSRRRALPDAERAPAMSPGRSHPRKRANAPRLRPPGGWRAPFRGGGLVRRRKHKTASEDIGHHLRLLCRRGGARVEGRRRAALRRGSGSIIARNWQSLLCGAEEAELVRRACANSLSPATR